MADPARIKPELPKASSSSKDEQSRPEDAERASTSGGSGEPTDSAGQSKQKEEKHVSLRALYIGYYTGTRVWRILQKYKDK